MANQKKKPVVGITLGDINGIGPEVVVQLLAQDSLFKYAHIVVYGSTKVLAYYKNVANVKKLSYGTLKDRANLNQKQAHVVNCYSQLKPEIKMGEETEEAGLCALESIDAALEDIKSGFLDILITAPINKRLVSKHVNGPFTGHTGYIAKALEVKDYAMILCHESLRVGLTTEHIAVRDMPDTLNEEVIYKKIKSLHHSLERDFYIHKPKVAVLALNPHAGENGVLGSEEQEVINPAINRAYRDGHYVYGPYPADGFFGSSAYSKFDGVVAMYHDQGLIPFKTLSLHSGVNMTAGLPVVRTSPDHGTAYDIVGKNKASFQSMSQAFFMGLDIYRNRLQYDEDRENAIEKKSKRREKKG